MFCAMPLLLKVQVAATAVPVSEVSCTPFQYSRDGWSELTLIMVIIGGGLLVAPGVLPGLLVPVIGNTYAGAAVIGLTAILDIAQAGDRILMVSFGSGAGSDAFDIVVTDKLAERRDRATKTQDYIARRTEIDYATYVRFRGKLAMK